MLSTKYVALGHVRAARRRGDGLPPSLDPSMGRLRLQHGDAQLRLQARSGPAAQELKTSF